MPLNPNANGDDVLARFPPMIRHAAGLGRQNFTTGGPAFGRRRGPLSFSSGPCRAGARQLRSPAQEIGAPMAANPSNRNDE
jgi:hypothetical protein